MSGKKDMKTKKLLENFLPYYGRYKKILIFDSFHAALTTLRELVLLLMPRYIINQGMQNLASITVGIVIRISGLYLLLRIIDSLAAYYMACTGHVTGVYVETDTRQDAFEHLQMLSDGYYGSTKVEQVISRIISDLFDVAEFARHCPEEFFIAALKTVVSFIIPSGINLELTLLVFVLVPVIVISRTWFSMKAKEAFRRQRDQIGELNTQIKDTLLGNRVVRTFANEPVEIAKFGKGSRDLMNIERYTYRYMAAFQVTTRSFDGLMYVMVVVTGGIFMIQGKAEPGDLVAYTMYVTTPLTTMRRTIEFVEQFQRGIAGIERFQRIVDVVPDIKGSRNVKKMEHVKGAITLGHVSFEYPDDHVPVLEDTNITVGPGERIALVGPSGSGKTTMCNLLPRFYDTTPGGIAIDGRDIKNVTLQNLRSSIDVVQQGVYLFSGFIYENISYGRPGVTREEVMEAVKLADAHEFITELQDRYDTYVGERGVKLSKGQKQHISIARILLEDPAILTLDEVTLALDNESEYLVSQSLEKLAMNRTTLAITHHLAAIQGANRILMLAGNKIVEEGNHEQLLKKKRIYYQLCTIANRLNQGIT